jgi:serine/threonine protein kinase
MYTLPTHLSQSSRDLLLRMLVVDPMKRITMPDVRAHHWFQHKLPAYLELPPEAIDKNAANKYDDEIINQVLGKYCVCLFAFTLTCACDFYSRLQCLCLCLCLVFACLLLTFYFFLTNQSSLIYPTPSPLTLSHSNSHLLYKYKYSTEFTGHHKTVVK